jgi:hypothetical protein
MLSKGEELVSRSLFRIIFIYPRYYFMCYGGLTLKTFSFTSQTVFVCFVRISEQTANFSLHSINCLDLITEMENVYCAVRTGSLGKRERLRFVLKVLSDTN